MRRLLLVIALMVGASAAHADGPMVYAGAGITRDKLSDIQATASDLNATSWKILVGMRPISVFAVEADYIDLGSQTQNFQVVNFTTRVHESAKAFAAYAVGFAPIPVKYVDVFGKLGFARWSVSGSATQFPGGSLFSLSDNGTDIAWGVGGQVHFGNIGGRVEYENFHVRNTNGAGIFSASVFFDLL